MESYCVFRRVLLLQHVVEVRFDCKSCRLHKLTYPRGWVARCEFENRQIKKNPTRPGAALFGSYIGMAGTMSAEAAVADAVLLSLPNHGKDALCFISQKVVQCVEVVELTQFTKCQNVWQFLWKEIMRAEEGGEKSYRCWDLCKVCF